MFTFMSKGGLMIKYETMNLFWSGILNVEFEEVILKC